MSHRALLFVICYLATVTAGLSASLFSQFLPPITLDLLGATDKGTIGQLGSLGGGSFLFGWSVGAVIMGALGDRVGRRSAMFASVLLCTLGTMIMSVVHNVPLLILVRFVTGAGAGSILLMSAVFVTEAWATHGRARMVGIIANSFPVGLIVSGLIATGFPNWRLAHMVGGSTVLLSLGVLLFVRESEWWASSETMRREKQQERDALFAPVFRSDLLAGTLLFGSMLVGLWAVFVWMPTWVGTLGGGENANALRSLTNMLLGLGSVAGGFASGPLSERVGRRRAAAFGYVGCTVLTLTTFLPDHTPGMLLWTLTFSLSVCIGLNQGILVGYIPELFPTLIRGLATGVCFNVGRLITVASVFAMGILISFFDGYDTAILTFGTSYIVGLITLSRARETQGTDLPA